MTSPSDKASVPMFGSLSGMTFLVLLVLKLCNLAEVTWFWVFFPLWIGWVVVGAVCMFIFLGALVWECVR